MLFIGVYLWVARTSTQSQPWNIPIAASVKIRRMFVLLQPRILLPT